MTSRNVKLFGLGIVALMLGIPTFEASGQVADSSTTLTPAGQKLEADYAGQLERLRVDLTQRIPAPDQATAESLDRFLASDALDRSLVKFVVLREATPGGLAAYAQRGTLQQQQVERLLDDFNLMKQMLVADGANARAVKRSFGPAQYGNSIKILEEIRQSSQHAANGVLGRLALAIALEHAVPVVQTNPVALTEAPATVDPVERYRHFERAYLSGELDPAFGTLTTWELRMVVDGDEPDEILAWGREMLRNYRPDHTVNPDYGWRYVSIVASDVKYGSQNVKYDRPELQKYQNILMNGGVCGRRAFFGRFILRAFGIPTIARPSRGHGALAHWTPDGWVVNLGGGWGAGWTATRYRDDLDFLATTQARNDRDAFLKVKRAQWIGDVLGERRVYGEHDGKPEFWNSVALKTQRDIIEGAKSMTLDALGEELGEADQPGVFRESESDPDAAVESEVVYEVGGGIRIPATAFSRPKGNTADVVTVKSFDKGWQVLLPRFFPQGQTILRGGTWKGEPEACTSGKRMLSGGYGRYENWGLRAAMSAHQDQPHPEITLDLGHGVTMDLVYIPPGTFTMGGESTTDGRFHCVEVPRHEVTLTRGFYLGKYEVTQAQYTAVMGNNPSRSTKAPDCPVDNVGESDAVSFCGKLAELTGQDVRLPTEAEWEHASRAGRDTRWFFGNDPSGLEQYAWFKANADGKSHPVGQKKPNPWGLYDIYGNVCERISDKYARDYYANSPDVDPTGPSQGSKSHLEYRIDAPGPGTYLLTARVVTNNAQQRINLAVNNSPKVTTIELPFTEGTWQDSEPIVVELQRGKNSLQLWRDNPPQYGIAVKEFRLEPAE